MNIGNIGDSVICLGMACAKDLPDIEYESVDWSDEESRKKPLIDRPKVKKKRRPDPYECDVYSFPQQWASTALGFGGMGGQAMTTAQTSIIYTHDIAAVYFGVRLAYIVVKPSTKFWDDVNGTSMASVKEALTRYEGLLRPSE